MPLVELFNKYTSLAAAKAHKLTSGGFMQPSPLYKWRRNDGLATFLRNMLDLRKTISLCHSCERKMPSRWLSRYNYELVKELSADNCPCDYCRNLDSVNLFVPGDGPYFAQYDLARRSVAETTQRERAAMDKDWRTILPGT